MLKSTRLRQATRALAALTVIASTAVGVTHAACWDTGTTPKPTAQYNLLGPAGTVVDTATLMMWKQCVEGLSGSGCAIGVASTMKWAAANTTASDSTWAGYNDWRLPSISELQSLVASACSNAAPTINAEAFPATPRSNVWSGSPYPYSSGFAWNVDFSDGLAVYAYGQTFANQVRLVRGGQSMGVLAPTAQTLTFSTPLPTLPFGGTAVVAATSGAPNSANPVVYASTTPTVCTVNASSGVVSLANAAVVGSTCTLSANQFGRVYNGQDYAQATQITQSLSVSKGAQSVVFGAAPAVSVSGTGHVSAVSNQGITPLTFISATPGTCTVSGTNGNIITGVTVGICTITASAPSNANYLVATATQSFSVGIGTQTLAFGAAPTINVGSSGMVTATSNQALATVTLSTTTPLVCTISSGTVLGVSAGMCTIYAAARSGANYIAATATQSFGIGIGAPTLTFGTAPLVTVGGTGSVTVTSDKTASPVSLTSSTPTCTVNSGVVNGVSAGVCTLQATQPAASSYSAGSASLSFSIGAAPLVCDLRMNGANPMLATVEGLILTRAMLGLKGSAVTEGTGITTPWDTIRIDLNAKCGTAFLP